MIQFVRENGQLIIMQVMVYLLLKYTGAISLVAVPGLFVLLKRQERYREMILTFFFVIVLSDNYYVHQASTVKSIVALLLALFVVLDRASFQLSGKIVSRLVPFFLIAAIAVYFSPIATVSSQKLLSYLIVWSVIPIYILKIYEQNPEEKFIQDLILFSTGLLIISIILIYAAPNIAYHKTGRFRGIFGNPNGLGLFLVFLSYLYVLIRGTREKLVKWDKIIVLGVACVCLYLCGSRTAILSLVLLSLTYFTNRASIFLSIAIGIIFGMLGEQMMDTVVGGINQLGLESYFRLETAESGSGRFVAWGFAWEEINRFNTQFFFGKGFGYTSYYFKLPENAVVLSMLGHQGHAHNSYLTFWLDTGLFGLVAFLFGWIRITISSAKNSKWALPILMSTFFIGFFESSLTASLNPYMIQLVIFYTCTILLKDQFEKEKVE